MKYFKIDTDWNADHDSPWHCLRPVSRADDFDCLNGSLALRSIWNSPSVALRRSERAPSVFSFEFHWAITADLKAVLEPLVREEAEFLPVRCELGELFVIHALRPVDFDQHAQLQKNDVSKNVTVVNRYSFTFPLNATTGPRQLFRMLQPEGSAARRYGYTLTPTIVSELCMEALQSHSVSGIRFTHIHTVA